MIRSVGMMAGRIRRGDRKQYHLRFSEPVAIPKDAKRPRKHRKSMDLFDDDEYSESSTPRSSSKKLEVRWSHLNLNKGQRDKSMSSESLDSVIEHKYDDSMDSVELDMNANRKRKRRWSRELEVGLKNAVEDAMT